MLPEFHVNIILFDPTEVELPLPRSDSRAVHLLKVLRRKAGDTFDVGLINGPRGRGTVVEITSKFITLAFIWGESPPAPCLIHIIVGLPRPQTARDILRDATTLGVAALHFVRTDKGENSYADSSLWKTHQWKECVINGAAQAFSTHLPKVTHGESLAGALAAGPQDAVRLALDNYEAGISLTQAGMANAQSVVLALGSERGWSAAERDLLRFQGFDFVHLGARVLRTETACIAAIILIKARLNWL